MHCQPHLSFLRFGGFMSRPRQHHNRNWRQRPRRASLVQRHLPCSNVILKSLGPSVHLVCSSLKSLWMLLVKPLFVILRTWLHENQPCHLVRIQVGKHARIKTSSRITHKNEWRRDARVSQGPTQVLRDVLSRARGFGALRQSQTRTIVRDDTAEVSDGGKHVFPTVQRLPQSRLEYDGRSATAPDDHPHAVASCIDPLREIIRDSFGRAVEMIVLSLLMQREAVHFPCVRPCERDAGVNDLENERIATAREHLVIVLASYLRHQPVAIGPDNRLQV